MVRLILMIVLAGAVWSYFPESRYWLLDKLEPVLQPVFEWQTKGEMREIARGLQTYEREHYGQLPNRRSWPDWLEANYHGEAGRDSWGGQYHLTADADSFRVISSGPDQVYRSEDDLVIARRFENPGRRRERR